VGLICVLDFAYTIEAVFRGLQYPWILAGLTGKELKRRVERDMMVAWKERITGRKRESSSPSVLGVALDKSPGGQ
jgi:hypothetical protein